MSNQDALTRLEKFLDEHPSCFAGSITTLPNGNKTVTIGSINHCRLKGYGKPQCKGEGPTVAAAINAAIDQAEKANL